MRVTISVEGGPWLNPALLMVGSIGSGGAEDGMELLCGLEGGRGDVRWRLVAGSAKLGDAGREWEE